MTITIPTRRTQRVSKPKIPATMRAAAIDRFGPPAVLKLHDDVPVPAIGANGAHRFRVGDRVYAYNWVSAKSGFYARVRGRSGKEDGEDAEPAEPQQAGATAVIGLTALQGVDDALPVKRGEHVIVHGASGGVGTCAMQFAKLRRARVLGTEPATTARRRACVASVTWARAGAGAFSPGGLRAGSHFGV